MTQRPDTGGGVFDSIIRLRDSGEKSVASVASLKITKITRSIKC